MSRFAALLRACGLGVPAAPAADIESLRAAAKTLTREMAGLRKALDRATTDLAVVRDRLEQLVAVQSLERDAPARLDRLERALDAGRVGAHVRQAIAAATVVSAPLPHAVVHDVFPQEAYDAIRAAIPDPLFFGGPGTAGAALAVPPPLAPTDVIATWAFVADIVSEVVAPAAAVRFDMHPLGLAAERGRLVRCGAAAAATAVPRRASQALTGILSLARPGDANGYRCRLGGGMTDIPLPANTLLLLIDPAGAHECLPVAAGDPCSTEGYFYECGFKSGSRAVGTIR